VLPQPNPQSSDVVGSLATVKPSFCWALVLVPALGCATPFDGRTYYGEGYSFSVPSIPPTWTRIHVSDAALAFDDSANSATIAVNGRCDRDGEDVPLRSLTQHLFIDFTDRDIHSEDVVPFDGREAMRTDVSAKLDGVERHLVVWVMKKDKCVYDLMYLARPDRFAAGVGTFDAWVKGFSARRDP
jgi:hypothetical protein